MHRQGIRRSLFMTYMSYVCVRVYVHMCIYVFAIQADIYKTSHLGFGLFKGLRINFEPHATRAPARLREERLAFSRTAPQIAGADCLLMCLDLQSNVGTSIVTKIGVPCFE